MNTVQGYDHRISPAEKANFRCKKAFRFSSLHGCQTCDSKQSVEVADQVVVAHLRDLRADCVPLPSLEEQREIVRRVGDLFKLADAIENRVSIASVHADKLTQSILAKAFRGELVPTEAELARREGRDYEPASVLLERILAERANRTSAVASAKRNLRKAGAHASA